MTKLPEGRSTLTDEQMIGLTHRLVDTCIDCKGRIEELKADLAKALEEAERYQHAFAAQSRKLQAVLHIEGVRTTLAAIITGTYNKENL